MDRPNTPEEGTERGTRARPAHPLEQGGVRVVCAGCGAFVAEARARIEVNGAHAHAFINPAGLIFRVGCFSEAPGACAVGEASEHWTWFAGFAWQAVLCRACQEHLGWFYDNSRTAFVALILDRVEERGGSEHTPRAPAG